MSAHFNQVTLNDDFDYDSDMVEEPKKSIDEVVAAATKESKKEDKKEEVAK